MQELWLWSLVREDPTCHGAHVPQLWSPCSRTWVCELSHFSRVRLFAALWTVAQQAPLSMEFSRQEYWSGLPLPPAGDLPNPGIKPRSPMSPALTGRFFTTSATWEAPRNGESQLLSPCAHEITLPKPMCPRAPAPQQEKPPPGGVRASQWRVAPALHN